MMTNKKTIQELEKAIKRLETRLVELKAAERRISIKETGQERRDRKRALQDLRGKLISKIACLESVLADRQAETVEIPPLKEAQVKKFQKAMADLNKVIKADQTFDAIVAVAKGVIAASREIDHLAGDTIPDTEEA